MRGPAIGCVGEDVGYVLLVDVGYVSLVDVGYVSLVLMSSSSSLSCI